MALHAIFGVYGEITAAVAVPVLQYMAGKRPAVQLMLMHCGAVGVAMNQRGHGRGRVWLHQREYTGFGGVGNFAFAFGAFAAFAHLADLPCQQAPFGQGLGQHGCLPLRVA